MSAIDRRSNVVLDSPPLVYPDVIAQNAKYFGSKACVVCGDERLTWAELDARTNQVANALIELGLEHGDRVCLHMSTSIAMFELMLGTVKAGGVTVPLNVMMAKESLPLMIENAGGPFVFTDESTVDVVDAIRSSLTVPDDRFCTVGCDHDGWFRADDA